MRKETTGIGALVLALATLVVSGCASVPREIARAPAGDFTVQQVRADVQGHLGMPVRWGGTILDLDNDAEESRIEIIARELRRDGRPAGEERSPGRFVAVVDGFLDPAIFVEGRDITVFGTVEGELDGRIGGRSYTYPVVRVEDYQLWRRMDAREFPYGHRAFFYDPFYPWGPYYHAGPRFRPLPPAPPRRPSVLRP